jgi:hypothetical protein
MKKLLSLASVATFILALPALAGDEKMDKSEWAKGTISAWDDAGKTFKVKDDAGKEWSFTRKETCQLHGTAKTGEPTMVEFTKDEDGKAWAHHVYVGKDEIAKAEKMMKEKESQKAGAHN